MEFITTLRNQFPLLSQVIHAGYPLMYLDNAATTQKPMAVIDAMDHFYKFNNANVHRSIHALGSRATIQFEDVRSKVQRFINANISQECIFVRGTTEAVNLVAHSFVAPRILPGEEILITHMEHHSNIVPWQMICKKTAANLKVAPISYDGEILLDEFAKQLSENTKFVAITAVSNALGTINPIKKMIQMAHAYGALVLIDGAQAVPHMAVDVQDLDCDFYAFSAHKMYGPTGIGVLWGRESLLDDMVPYQGGGEMINHVSFDSTDYAALPHKFEAGTPNISGAIGLGAAIDFIWSLDLEKIRAYEAELLHTATTAIKAIHGFNIIGVAAAKIPIISLIHGKIHAHDIGTILDSEGIAVRSGHHCAMPLMDFFDIAATTRISLAFYNTMDEIERLARALAKVEEVFK